MRVVAAPGGAAVETIPLAGTRPRGATREEDLALENDLLADAKERAEHVMLVDLGRNDLGRVAVPGSVAREGLLLGRALLARHAHRLAGRRDARAGPRRRGRPRGDVPGGHAHGRAEDPRDGDHRGSRARPARGLRGRRRATSTSRGTSTSRSRSGRRSSRTGSLHVQAGAGIVADSDAESEARRVREQGAGAHAGRRAGGGVPVILVVDNYDSFTFNLVQILATLDPDVDVVRNDALSVDEILAKAAGPDRRLAGTGPARGRRRLLRAHRGGTRTSRSSACASGTRRSAPSSAAGSRGRRRSCTGRRPRSAHDGRGLFAGLPNPFTATRYHSLAVESGLRPGRRCA